MTNPVSRPVGLAMIGAGMASKPHFAALADLARDGSVRIVSVFTRDAARRQAAADSLRARAADSVDGIASDPEVDAVLLLTPPNARMDIVRTLAAGGKPVLMEKPVERTLAAAEELVATMASAGLPLGIVFQHRLKPASRRLAEILAGGSLGAPALVRLDVPWWRGQEYYDEPGRGTFARDGGGVLISQAIHALDLMLSLFGPVAEVQAMAGTSRLHEMETEDIATAGLVFADGSIGCLTATTACFPGSDETMTAVFDNATATLSGGHLRIAWRDGRTESFGDALGSGGGADPMAFDHSPHRAVIADFAEALVEGREPSITGRSALAVHRLIDAILTSSIEGRRVRIPAEGAT